MVKAKREDGYWLVEPYRHAPLTVDGEKKYGEDIAGPFVSEEHLEDFYLRMDYDC
jgi:hypothetical protein